MEIKVSSKHMGLTPAIEEYGRRKVEKLLKFFDRVQQIELRLDRARVGYQVEIIVDVEHHDDFVATVDHEDLYACIDLAVDRAARQLKDYKERVRDHKHQSPTGGKEQ